MSGSRTIIADGNRLDNVHPGSILRLDFLIGDEIPVAEVTAGTGLSHDRMEALLAEEAPINAEDDLRLGRYFGMSEGFFLGLQRDYDLEEARRLHGGELSRIIPRAA